MKEFLKGLIVVVIPELALVVMRAIIERLIKRKQNDKNKKIL